MRRSNDRYNFGNKYLKISDNNNANQIEENVKKIIEGNRVLNKRNIKKIFYQNLHSFNDSISFKNKNNRNRIYYNIPKSISLLNEKDILNYNTLRTINKNEKNILNKDFNCHPNLYLNKNVTPGKKINKNKKSFSTCNSFKKFNKLDIPVLFYKERS